MPAIAVRGEGRKKQIVQAHNDLTFSAFPYQPRRAGRVAGRTQLFAFGR
jgi:hypothetical protein